VLLSQEITEQKKLLTSMKEELAVAKKTQTERSKLIEKAKTLCDRVAIKSE
jgi:hypothetical protein